MLLITASGSHPRQRVRLLHHLKSASSADSLLACRTEAVEPCSLMMQLAREITIRETSAPHRKYSSSHGRG